MAERKIGVVPFTNKPYQNVDATGNSLFSDVLINGVLIPIDSGFLLRLRAGYKEFVDIGTESASYGYWWSSKALIIVVSGGSVFTVSSTSVVTNLGGVTIGTTLPVTFAEFGDNLFMANGTQIFYTDGTAAIQFIASGAAPTTCTHIQFINQYLVANDLNQDKFFQSKTGDPFTWSSLDYKTTESSFDNVLTILVDKNHILLFGEKSIEYWSNVGGDIVFRRNQTIQIKDGTLSPYSVTSTRVGVFYLNPNKEIYVLSDSGQRRKVSGTFDKVLQKLDVISDANGWEELLEGRGYYVITFPTEGKTYVYDYELEYWSERASWEAPNFTNYRGSSYIHAEGFDKHILLDSSNGKLYEMSFDMFDDDGEVIRLLSRTGHYGYGDDLNRKMNIEIGFRMKTGHAFSREPKMMYRRNVDNRGFKSERTLSLGKIGKTEMTRRLFTQGLFRTVQHEITVTDAVDFQLIAVQEEYEVLTSE